MACSGEIGDPMANKLQDSNTAGRIFLGFRIMVSIEFYGFYFFINIFSSNPLCSIKKLGSFKRTKSPSASFTRQLEFNRIFNVSFNRQIFC
ncbi:MAG: hypothetical protein K2J87_07290, partial [Muribaculaceae bacterium]|nr:hypothetical protein [Muribaculaceae bacterium]